MSNKKSGGIFLGVLLGVGVIAGAAALYQNVPQVKDWADKIISTSSSSEESQTSSSSDGSTTIQAEGKTLGFRSIASPSVHTSISCSASVYGEVNGHQVVATLHSIAWTFAWSDPLHEGDAGDYFRIESTSDTATGGSCVVSAKSAYSGKISLFATNPENVSAYVEFDCYNSIASGTVSVVTDAPYDNFKCADGVYHDYDIGIETISGGYAVDPLKMLRLRFAFSTDGGGISTFLYDQGTTSTALSDKDSGTINAFTTIVGTKMNMSTGSNPGSSFTIEHCEKWGGGAGIYVDVLCSSATAVLWAPSFSLDGVTVQTTGWTIQPYIQGSSVSVSAGSSRL